ncbi:MAG: SMC-Scp complex subunit ScpB [Patescibacteria group bacterium]|nr:SMC-Scp complex subunit ScpB [Patescibacteria group bacterium]MDE2438652.1 SMC-Scp complex subunit ScpB [Patescibacteria group bacterium]
MDTARNKRNIEALLFVHGEPLTLKKIGAVLEISEEEVRRVVDELVHEYAERGIVITEQAGEVAFSTHPATSENVLSFIGRVLEDPLTPAALETLSIIAYCGPLAKIDIDEMRGVNSYFILKNLSVRGLIEKTEDRAKNMVYDITLDALRHLGVSRKEELTSYEEFRTRLNEIRITGGKTE